MALDNQTCHRAAAIRTFMAGPDGLLRRYRPSTHLPDRLRTAEAEDLISDLDDALPNDVAPEELDAILEGTRRALRRAWGGPWWPTSTMLRDAAQQATQAAQRSRKMPDNDEAILGWLADWWRRHGRCAPGLGTPERTARLIRMGILTARQARVAAFPLTDRDEAAARHQPPCAAEVEIERRFRARLGRRAVGGSS
ncbi:hypothetical protein LOKVESSMR4R_03392 [Yoonia vestfoldensis]|uniref:Uncharacterized protein n=2 Tax=Yoonia vestfoldensis TaxID=245188 RepID=A0A1Y0EGF1_9RHOB|nr:hypothetical protein LOKVESSMR4R_03392 [Yoonia vestfoldensis]